MFFTFNAHAELSIESAAPAFELLDQDSKRHQLSDYSGKWLVLYFYPKDDTSGCTKEACNFRDDIYHIRELNAEVVGVSTDDVGSHVKFTKKYSLPFALLSDKHAVVAKSYGAAWKLGPLSKAKRHSFIISQDGKIVQIFRKVNAKDHSKEIIAALKSLQATE
jgi:thioredoxin-dependent peroxiredoxin